MSDNWYNDDLFERQVKAKRNIMKNRMIQLSCNNIIKDIREFYKNPSEYREKQKLKMFLRKNEDVFADIKKPFITIKGTQ